MDDILEALTLMRENQRRQRSLYFAEPDELNFLKAIVKEDIESFCYELIPDGYPSPNGKYWRWRENGTVINALLRTEEGSTWEVGRVFTEERGDQGNGDVIEFWRRTKDVFFKDAVMQVTQWCIDRLSGNETEREKLGRREKGKEKRTEDYNDRQPEIRVLKKVVYEILAPNGETIYPASGKALWSRVREKLGVDVCAKVYLLSSPERFKKFLRLFTDERNELFYVKKKTYKSYDAKRKRTTTRPVFHVIKTEWNMKDFPLEFERAERAKLGLSFGE